MEKTYGQLGYTYETFSKEVREMVNKLKMNYSDTVAKKLWKKGYSVADAVSFFIMHS